MFCFNVKQNEERERERARKRQGDRKRGREVEKDINRSEWLETEREAIGERGGPIESERGR